MPLQGEGLYTLIPRALPWAGNWLPFQGARGEGCGGLPLKGRVFKIPKNLCAIFCQTTSGKVCVHDKRTKREKERPERAASPQPRATHWVSAYKRLRPVREKVWANGWFLLLPLQGVGNGEHGTQGVALGSELVGLSARARPQIGLLRTIFID